MRRLAWSLSLILVLGIASASAQNDDSTLCRTGNGDVSIAACTRLIGSGKFKGHDLAAFYNRRGAVYESLADLDHAMADYGDAARLDPKFAEAFNNRGNVLRKKG